MELCGRRFDTGKPVCLDIVDGRISRVTRCTIEPDQAQAWPWIAPGFVDIQVNGYGGQEFSSAELTPKKVLQIVRRFDAFGVVRCCPTLTTESLDVLEHALGTIAAACESWPEVARRVAGVHLEGPYITPEDGARGAHPFEHCREPDWDEFQRLQAASGGRIRIHTMSPEFDGSPAYVRRVAESGVVVAIGHTSARPSQIRRAVEAGARLSTHLGNGSHARVHRHRNYIWAQLADDRLMASLVVDGHHLPWDVVKTFVRTKTADRCILVSDVSGQAGQPPGLYPSDFCDVELLPEGRLVVAGQRELLAGAALPIGPAIPNVMQYAGVELAEAVRMAVHNPARLLGIGPGGLERGDRADLVQFRLSQLSDEGRPRRFDLTATITGGEVVWGSLWQPDPGQRHAGTESCATEGCPTTRVGRPCRGARARTGRKPPSRGVPGQCRPPQAG